MIPSSQNPIPSSGDGSISDRELVRRFKADDKMAFETLFERYYEGLCAYACFMACDITDGRQVAADAFVDAYEGLLKYDVKCFRAWLYAIATHLIGKEKRRKKCIQWVSWEGLNEAGGGEEASVQQSLQGGEHDDFWRVEQADFIRSVMDHVSSEYQVCIYLDIFADMTQKEIGMVIGKDERTVRRYVARGKEELRQMYDHFVDTYHAEEG